MGMDLEGGALGAGVSAGILIGSLQIRHGIVLPRSAASTSWYFLQAGFGQRVANTMSHQNVKGRLANHLHERTTNGQVEIAPGRSGFLPRLAVADC